MWKECLFKLSNSKVTLPDRAGDTQAQMKYCANSWGRPRGVGGVWVGVIFLIWLELVYTKQDFSADSVFLI